MEVKLATKIRREKNENCVEFSFHSISGYFIQSFLNCNWDGVRGNILIFSGECICDYIFLPFFVYYFHVESSDFFYPLLFFLFEVQFSLGFITVQGGNICWLVSLIQIRPMILMIESILQVMFSVWDLDLSLGLVRNNKLLLFLQQKQNIELQLMLVRKFYGFNRSF